ncbi:hypothetical protein JVT61DRAFT_12142 [Boletus reticuloceps]|uniref:Uncharacterized protein n=1 Tax=Boletus reticuloceps TaxID=495285 RepID=A0A8I3A4K9_9AGAM|nr:hypothetical protein JVT61DRAFT_12142 [Boletus reticuloceps]
MHSSSRRDEGSITTQEWFHALPHLVNAIQHYLPGDQTRQIADVWAVHFNRLMCYTDFWEMFYIILCYDIHLHIHFVDPKCGIDPSIRQEEVWHQIVDTYCNNTQHLLPGLTGIPSLKAIFQSLPAPTSISTSSFSSANQTSALSLQSWPFPSQSGSSSCPPSLAPRHFAAFSVVTCPADDMHVASPR